MMKLDKKDPNVLNLGFLEALGRIRTYEKKHLKKENIDLTPKELNNLVIIRFHSELKQSEILELLDVSKGTFSTNVKTLIRKGYIKHDLSLSDKRIKKFIFTDKGERAIKINEAIREKIKANILSKISTDELNTFMDIALKMR